MASNCARTLSGMLAIVGVATIVGAAHSMLKPVQLKLKPQTNTTSTGQSSAGQSPTEGVTVGVVTGDDQGTPLTADPAPEHAGGDGFEIGLDEAKAFFDDFVVFLDARPLYQYEQGHILGAMWMPSQRIDDGGAGFIYEIEAEAGGMDQPVVIYCGGGDCDASHNLAIRLQQGGFTNLKIFTDGYPAWVEAGYETQVGAPPEIEP